MAFSGAERRGGVGAIAATVLLGVLLGSDGWAAGLLGLGSAVFDHPHVGSCAGAEDEDEGPDFEWLVLGVGA